MNKNIIGSSVLVKNLLRFFPHPWIWRKMAGLESAKTIRRLFPALSGNGRGGKIRQLSIRITDLCNLRCETCGQWGNKGYLLNGDIKSFKKNEMTTDRYSFLIDDLVEHGHSPLVYFWGGEPMLYNGTIDLIRKCTAKKLPCSIATNGTKIATHADAFAEIPLFLLQISIDGPSPEIHNKIRPSISGEDNFAEILSGLEKMQAARRRSSGGLPLIVSLTTISKHNESHLLDIYEKFQDKVDLFVFYLSWWIDNQTAGKHSDDFNDRFGFRPSMHESWISDIKPENYLEMELQLTEIRRRSLAFDQADCIIMPPLSTAEDLRKYYTEHSCRFGFDRCVSIFNSAEIDSNGDMSPCRDYRDFVVGNLKENTIDELWNSDKYVDYRKNIAVKGLMPACSRCCGLMGY